MVPWVLNNCAKWSGDRNPPPKPKACCARISTASISARASITKASTTYMMPIFLWSELVSHSDHSTPHLR